MILILIFVNIQNIHLVVIQNLQISVKKIVIARNMVKAHIVEQTSHPEHVMYLLLVENLVKVVGVH